MIRPPRKSSNTGGSGGGSLAIEVIAALDWPGREREGGERAVH